MATAVRALASAHDDRSHLLPALPSLIRALAAVPECRRPRGRRYGQNEALPFAV